MSHSDAELTVQKNRGGEVAGGLVGDNGGTIDSCYATGAVKKGSGSVGGLVGFNVGGGGQILRSYATGAAGGTRRTSAGGLIGYNEGIVSDTYSTGAPSSRYGFKEGFVGDDVAQSGSINDSYWDTDTSGITNLSQGAGNIANDPGITGLTTAQFQSGLPAGFNPTVWAENPNINGGLPYLLANPPPK